MRRQAGLSDRCFTLIEMLIAVALVAALVLILLPVAGRIVSGTAASADRGHRLAQVAILTDMLDRATLTAIATGAAGEPGLVGERDSLRVASCGVSLLPREPGQPDDVQTLHVRLSSGAVVVSESGGSAETVVSGVRRIEIAYADGEDWLTSHDGASGLPSAIAVSIWFGEPETESDDAEPALTEEETEPDWRRVFAVFDPSAAAEVPQ